VAREHTRQGPLVCIGREVFADRDRMTCGGTVLSVHVPSGAHGTHVCGILAAHNPSKYVRILSSEHVPSYIHACGSRGVECSIRQWPSYAHNEACLCPPPPQRGNEWDCPRGPDCVHQDRYVAACLFVLAVYAKHRVLSRRYFVVIS
jgi:hypothetical protein